MLDRVPHHGRWSRAYALLDRLISLGLVVVDGNTVTITRSGRALAEKAGRRDA